MATTSIAGRPGPAALILEAAVILPLLLVGILLFLLFLWSPGKPRPFLDSRGNPLPGSLSEKVSVRINGVRQGMFIRAKDASRPVLLYLHGGMPDYFLTARYRTDIESLFTVVWWEQRGSGMSYSASIPPETMNLEQLIADTLAVTDYLRQRFGRGKIYLMGHSGGSFVGIQAAARRPELYSAYIGEAQMSYQLESEKLAYDYMLGRFKEAGDTRMLARMEKAPVTMEGGCPRAYLALRDGAMHGLGIGTTRDMDSVVTGLFLPSLAFPEYSVGDKLGLWLGKSKAGVSVVWGAMLATDLGLKVTELEIPVYFLHGAHDYTCSYPLAQAFFRKLKAPVKGFYTFQDSAHSPLFEEDAKAMDILRNDILRGRNDLADPI